MKLSIVERSLVDPAVDAHATVNAGNPHIGLGSGVSGAISAACGGLSFQALVRAALADEFGEPLTQDDCLSTSSGTFDGARWVLHVAAVDYKSPDPLTGRASSVARVKSCFGAALEEAAYLAETHGLGGEFRLATPMLGARHGGLDLNESLEGIAQAARGASNQVRSQLRSLILCVPDPQSARRCRGYLLVC